MYWREKIEHSALREGQSHLRNLAIFEMLYSIPLSFVTSKINEAYQRLSVSPSLLTEQFDTLA